MREVHLQSPRVKKIEKAIEKPIKKKCYYEDEECWRNRRPYEGSLLCTNCLLAKTLRGFHPELMKKGS